jgi:hypothetical protein
MRDGVRSMRSWSYLAIDCISEPSSVGRFMASRSPMHSTVTSAAGLAAMTAGSSANLPWRGNTVVCFSRRVGTFSLVSLSQKVPSSAVCEVDLSDFATRAGL